MINQRSKLGRLILTLHMIGVGRHIQGTYGGAFEVHGRGIQGHAPAATFSYDLCMQFTVLPKIPVLLLYNDADEEFPDQCAVPFERRAENYLDMECLAMVGMLLFEYLKDECFS